MKYTHKVHAYYDTNGRDDYRLKPLDKTRSSVVLAVFMANDVKAEGSYVTFNSGNAWGNYVQSKFHKDNVVKIEENCNDIPESKREFVSQYAEKFIEVHGDSFNDLSDKTLEETFKDCALPLRPVFYPMCREEIFRVWLRFKQNNGNTNTNNGGIPK